MKIKNQQQENLKAILDLTGISKIPNDWSIFQLEELIEDKFGVSVGVMYPGTHVKDGIPLFRAGDLSENIIRKMPDFLISKSVHEEYKRTELKEGDLLISLVGNVGNCAIVPKSAEGFNAARAIAVIKLKNKDNGRWIRFCLNSPQFRLLMNNWSNTTVQTTLNLKDLKKIPIPFPPRTERVELEKILSIIEDKIELNIQINSTLEAMAKAIFKDWFIDFGPVKAKAAGKKPFGMDDETAALFPDGFEESELGVVPRGWKYRKINELLETVSETYKFSPQEKVVFLNTSDILKGDFLTSKMSDSETLPGQAKKKIQKGDILYSEIRPENCRYAYVYFDSHNYVVSTKLMVLRSKKIDPLFLYFYLTRDEFISEMQHLAESRSGTFPQITFDVLGSREILLPNMDLLNRFIQFLKLIYEQQISLSSQNKNLEEIRDLLLPKLISGEIELGDLNG